MRISVLMSLFVKEDPLFFDKSIQSVWNDQTRKPDEIVIVEDGPVTKELDVVLSKWKETIPSLKIVKLHDNCGLATALNEGAKVCSCDYIARMDTDDISLPYRFKLQEEYLLTHPEVAVLGGGMIEFSDEEGEMQPRHMPLTTEEIKKTICKTSPLVHPSVLIKKEIFDLGYAYNPRCRRNQDLEFWFRLLAAGFRIENLDKVLIKYRKDPLLYVKRKKSAWLEFRIVINGIYLLYGIFTWRYVFPIIHYLFRLLPSKWCLFIYKKIILKIWNHNN